MCAFMLIRTVADSFGISYGFAGGTVLAFL